MDESKYSDLPEVEIEEMTFGERLKRIRKEKGMNQDAFAALIGTSKQVLSRYEIGQRVPKISLVEKYAKALDVTVDYLMGDSQQEAAFNSLCPGNRLPFYKIFVETTEQMGLDIPGIVRVTGLTDRQVRTIITRRMKDAPLPIALRLADTLGVPLEVWAGENVYKPQGMSVEAREVAMAYDQASLKDKNTARLALDLEPVREAWK